MGEIRGERDVHGAGAGVEKCYLTDIGMDVRMRLLAVEQVGLGEDRLGGL